jgi:hypothetical protein
MKPKYFIATSVIIVCLIFSIVCVYDFSFRHNISPDKSTNISDAIPDIEMKNDTVYIPFRTRQRVGKIDIYYFSKKFRIPYYLPTNGIFRDFTKDNECNWDKYPATVNCYTYDPKNRVIKMDINGSGVMDAHTYSYDENDNITCIHDIFDKYIYLKYNRNGSLEKMTVKHDSVEVYYFKYLSK